MPEQERKHIDVMISSTSRDLPEHREAVRDAAFRMSMFPVVMETLGARSHADAISASLEMVDISEIYVGIFGMRYGFIPDDPRNPDKISITEMEYRRAVERDIPILIFIMDEDEHPIKPKDVDTDPEKVAKLTAFKDHLKNKHIVGFFKSPDELGLLAIQGLAREAIEAAKRAGENDPETLDEKEELIVPPELLALPRYTLTANFIGRQRELAQLDSWSQNAEKPMMVVEAIGGMGKSALTWEWVNKKAQSDNYDGRFWYSFYEGGTNMQSFLRDAVAYFREVPKKEVTANRSELEKELMRILETRRVLLVLDGLERVLVAYHRFDAAHIRDDQIDEKERQRKTTDPKDGRFLKLLATCKKGKVLLSSRLMPLSLEGMENITHEKLTGLDPDDAYDLMRDRGVKEPQNRQQMNDFMAQFGYHGLLLTITAGRISSFFQAPGDFDLWYQIFGKDLRDPDIQKARLKLLKYAFEGLDEAAQKFLSQIAAFQDAVPYETLSVFNPFGTQPPKFVPEPKWDNDVTEEEHQSYLLEKEAYEQYQTTQEYINSVARFHNLLRDLTDRGLLNWERDKNTYDLHPVVRGYSFEQLDGKEKEATYNKIHNHFESRPVNYDEATSVEDLYNPIMVYRALVGAGRLEDAARLFQGSFGSTLIYALSASHLIIELLRSLFIDGLDAFPPFNDDYLKGFITNDLALVFRRAGQLDQALPLQRLNIQLFVENKVHLNLSGAIRNLTNILANNNQLILAIHTTDFALKLSKLDEEHFWVSSAHGLLLRYHSLVGHWEQAEKHNVQIDDGHDTGYISVFRAEKAVYKGEDASEQLDVAWQRLTAKRQYQWVAPVKALRARNHLRLGRVDEALQAIEEAITTANKQGRAELASYHATRGLIWMQMGKLEDAKKDVDTAIETNLYPAEFAHIYNCASRVYQQLGDEEKAKDYAIEAYTYAWADGEPYVRWYDLQEAKKQLDALGVPHPQLEPYDTDNPEKVFMEDEILALIDELKAKKEAEKQDSDDDYDPFGDET